METQEEVAATIPWVRGIRRITYAGCASQGIADFLMILARGGAIHLADLFLWEDQFRDDSAATTSQREALTAGFQELSLLQPPLHILCLLNLSAWSSPLHLPLLHTAVASTLSELSLRDVDACIFASHLPWPRLQSLELIDVPKMGYEGPLTEPIFPVLTAISMLVVDEIQAPEDLFPALETIRWYSETTTPEKFASLIRHDIKRIDMDVFHTNIFHEPLWEAMGGHTIDLIALAGRFPGWMHELADDDIILPRFPNVRKFTIEWREDDSDTP
jgi:hypothetical protein